MARRSLLLLAFQASPAAAFTCMSRSTILKRTVMSATKVPSWSDLQQTAGATKVGAALNEEVLRRSKGDGSAHVQNTLRKFGKDNEPPITLYRDHAGWCPYCQKTMLLIEEKKIPIQIGLVPMRSYGDKPKDFLNKVPSGLLPAIEVNGKVITESQVIMDLLDQWHTAEEGYKPMMPSSNEGKARYQKLARLEREYVYTVCT
jgi:glutathione S-transferase